MYLITKHLIFLLRPDWSEKKGKISCSFCVPKRPGRNYRSVVFTTFSPWHLCLAASNHLNTFFSFSLSLFPNSFIKFYKHIIAVQKDSWCYFYMWLQYIIYINYIYPFHHSPHPLSTIHKISSTDFIILFSYTYTSTPTICTLLYLLFTLSLPLAPTPLVRTGFIFLFFSF
jgi:hypothetical protein